MGCFCKAALSQLQALQPALAPGPPSNTLAEQAAPVMAAAQALAQRGLPAPVWQPSPDWLSLELPTMAMSASAVVTLSALIALRAQAQADLGLDLLVPGQAQAFARIVATMNARLLSITVDGGAWIQLAAIDRAAAQVAGAVSLNPEDPERLAPAGIAASRWEPFIAKVTVLAPLIAMAIQLNLDLSADFITPLAAAARAMLAISLPPGNAVAAAQLASTLTAVAHLSASLQIPVLSAGIREAESAVAQRVAAVTPVAKAVPNSVQNLPTNPGKLAAPSVVAMAAEINIVHLAQLTWNAPPIASLPMVTMGQAAAGLLTHLRTTLNLTATQSSPCTACDAARILGAQGLS